MDIYCVNLAKYATFYTPRNLQENQNKIIVINNHDGCNAVTFAVYEKSDVFITANIDLLE